MNNEDLRAIKELLQEELKLQLEPIGLQFEESTDILKRLKHNSEVNPAEADKMSNEIADIKENLKSIDESMEAMKAILGRHEVDIRVLKRRQFKI